MRTLLGIPISFLIYFVLARTIGGLLSGMYSPGNERPAVITAFIILFAISFISGYLGGYISRDRFGPLIGGILIAIYFLSYNDQTLICRAIFYAPYATLGSDNVLLGLSLVLFTFLWGGKLGEQYGFRQDRSRLLPDGV